MKSRVVKSNFRPLAEKYRAIAEEGMCAEQFYVEERYRDALHRMRNFGEGLLKHFLKCNDLSYAEMLRHPAFRNMADSDIVNAFYRVKDIGNENSHFIFGEVTMRDGSDVRYCLRHCRDMAAWFWKRMGHGGKYPEFVDPAEDVVTEVETSAAAGKFDPWQQKVINLAHSDYENNRHLVLAPPGCGKTAILTQRIKTAHAAGVPYSEMLCLTFTNRAARGMKERIAEEISGTDMEEIYVGNLHRFCSKFLFENNLVPNTTEIIDEEEAAGIIADIHFDLHYSPYDVGLESETITKVAVTVPSYIQRLAARISMREMGFDVKLFPGLPPIDMNYCGGELNSLGLTRYGDRGAYLDDGKMLEIAERYAEYKVRHNLIDFDDLLVLTLEDLQKGKGAGRYSWIQVDEVQDLSPLQLEIIRLLWNEESKLGICVLFGDEQQAIFSFMGAKLEVLTQLKDTHVVHHLVNNYRSPGYLLDVYNRYAEHELNVAPEILPKTVNAVTKPADALTMVTVDSENDQCNTVAMMAGCLEKHENMVAIVNSNKFADNVSNYLTGLGIEHFKISGTDVFRSRVVKLLKAYLAVLQDDYRLLPWGRIFTDFSRKKGVKYSKVRKYLLENFRQTGLLPSDLMLYGNDGGGPISYVDDFMRSYRGTMVVFDTETTGLEVGIDEVVQIAAVKIVDGKETDRMVVYLKTNRDIPEMLGEIRNPMFDEYRDQEEQGNIISAKDGILKFLEFVGDAAIVGHNVDYDCNIVDAQFMVMAREAGDLVGDKTLHKLKRFDTLKLSHAFDSVICEKSGVEKVESHKLGKLLGLLHISGHNSHLAQDDVAATVNLMAWFADHAPGLVAKQTMSRQKPGLREMSDSVREGLLELYCYDRALMHMPSDPKNEAVISQVIRRFLDRIARHTGEFEKYGTKIALLPKYIDQDIVDKESHRTLYAQLQSYGMQIGTLTETDLCGSSVMKDRIVIATVHKAKGLEFDNVAVLNVVRGVYPFFKSETREAVQEDARKLYVAMTRAKKRLTLVSFSRRGDYPVEQSYFVRCISGEFVGVK